MERLTIHNIKWYSTKYTPQNKFNQNKTINFMKTQFPWNLFYETEVPFKFQLCETERVFQNFLCKINILNIRFSSKSLNQGTPEKKKV